MALPDLASTSDLSARSEDAADSDSAALMLTVASALVRGAAQSPISETASVVSLWATDEGPWLDLPGQPISEVSAVTVDGTAVTDYKLVNGRLWRRGWTWCDEPLEVVVTMTHGLATVPADIVQLVCDLAILGTDTATDGALDPRVITEKIDDYSVSFSPSASAVATAMTLPAMTRQSLRARFGGGAALVRHR